MECDLDRVLSIIDDALRGHGAPASAGRPADGLTDALLDLRSCISAAVEVHHLERAWQLCDPPASSTATTMRPRWWWGTSAASVS